MSAFANATNALRPIVAALSPMRRRQAIATVALMMVGALAEVVSVGSILPFLAVLTNPARIAHVPLVGGLLGDLSPGPHLVAVAALGFMGLTLVSAGLRLLLTWYSQAFAFNLSHDLSVTAFHKVIRQPYLYYVRSNSSEIVAKFEKIHSITYGVLLAGVNAITSSVIAALLIALMIALNPVVALISALVFIGIYVATSFLTRQRLSRNSMIVSTGWGLKVKSVQQAVGGIRDILLDGSQDAFERDFERHASGVRDALTANAFISSAPRVVIETIGMILIGALAWTLAGRQGGIVGALPTLGALALGAQRLLPLLQNAYLGWSNMRGAGHTLVEVSQLVSMHDDRISPTGPPLPFDHSIDFAHVGYRYDTGRPVLRDVSFTIRRGERIGIVGATGAGKSTVMDLLLGLLEPSDGAILIDGQPLDRSSRIDWQSQVAHVPQAIYLLDDTIAANIAFGAMADAIDLDRVRHAASSAGIDDFVLTLPDGYQTMTGERGVRLSGGQRQRIGIARALYKRAAVLVLDEATSALDNVTEAAVMASIDRLRDDITIIIIAHRLTTLAGCHRILCLDQGTLARTVTSVEELG